jgi:hypothetical protein
MCRPDVLPSAKAQLSQNSAPVGQPASAIGYESAKHTKAPYSTRVRYVEVAPTKDQTDARPRL